MGSFNVHCAVSHVPIEDGDDVVLFGLNLQNHVSDIKFAERFGPQTPSVWGDNYYNICSYPVYGSYSDGGRIVVDKTSKDDFEFLLEHTKLIRDDKEPLEDDVHTSTHNLMFIHAEVYRWLINRKPNWHEKEAKKRCKEVVEKYRDHDETNRIENFMRGREWSETFVSPQLTKIDPVWRNYLGGNVQESWRYFHEIRPVTEPHIELGYRIFPSLYAGQEATAHDTSELRKIVEDISQRSKEKYEGFYYE
jgi:hypothetical protein